MDDMQSRIAARRAEIERERRDAGAVPTAADKPADDTSDIFEGLFGDRGASTDPAADTGNARLSKDTASTSDVGQRAAARRAEIERDRREADAAAAVAAEKRREEGRRAADEVWAAKAYAQKASGEPIEAGRGGDPMEELIRDGVSSRWTTGEKAWVAIIGVAGLLLLSSHPVAGVIAVLLAVALYAGTNAKYRSALRRQHPDLFSAPPPPADKQGELP